MSFYITVDAKYIIRNISSADSMNCRKDRNVIQYHTGRFDGPFKGDRICKKMYVLEALFL